MLTPKARLPGAGFLALLGLAVYWPALHGQWLWDDDYEITHDQVIKLGSGWWRVWLRPASPDYFPLKTELQWCEWHLWGDRVLGYHLVNLGFHILAAFLLWRILGRLAGGAAGFLGGALFLVHPLAVESVAWISELKNVMSLAFVLLAFDAWMDWEDRAAERAGVSGLKRNACAFRYLAALAWFTAAMLCKTSVVMFPAVLLLFAWWRRGGVEKEDLKASLPFFGVSLVLGLVTLWFQSHRALGGLDLHLGGWLWRLGSAAMAIVFYFFKSLWPVGLMPIYPDWGGKHIWFQPLACGGLILIGLAVLWRKRAGWGRAGLFGIGFFLVNLLPVLGFLPMSYLRISRVADHLAYLPLIGIVSLAAVLLSRTPRRLALGAVLALVLAAASREQAKIFRSPLAFWTYGAEHNPDAPIAQNDRGNALYDAGRVQEATDCYRRAVELDPDYAEAHNNLGNMFLNHRQLREAMDQYREALRILPTYATPQNGIGLALLRTGHPAEAIPRFQLAIRASGEFAEAHYNLGLALADIGRRPEAIEQFRIALEIRPAYPEAMTDLGSQLWGLGQAREAIALYRDALRINPDYPEAHYNLGVVLHETGNLAGAEAEFRTTVRLLPAFAPARQDLGVVLREEGKAIEAPPPRP